MNTDAYERLRQELLRGTLKPGERLRVADLNDRYRLGLTPIREALMRLTSEGFVSWENHRGARVATIDSEEFRDMVRTRQEIGRLCLTKAIELGDTVWEAEILRSFHLLSRTPFPDSSDTAEIVATWERFHREFHYALIAACGSPWLLRIWNMLSDHSERYRKVRLLCSDSWETDACEANREHEVMMEAVLARDVAAATALLDRHLIRTEEAVVKLIEPGGK